MPEETYDELVDRLAPGGMLIDAAASMQYQRAMERLAFRGVEAAERQAIALERISVQADVILKTLAWAGDQLKMQGETLATGLMPMLDMVAERFLGPFPGVSEFFVPGTGDTFDPGRSPGSE